MFFLAEIVTCLLGILIRGFPLNIFRLIERPIELEENTLVQSPISADTVKMDQKEWLEQDLKNIGNQLSEKEKIGTHAHISGT